jgi:hypothetical protein
VYRSERLERMVWITAAVAVALAWGFYLYGRKVAAPATTVEASAFAIDANALDGKLQLTWRPEQPQVQAASSGVVTVVDGGMTSTHPIDQQALRSGNWDYANQTDDVALSLTLLTNNTQLAQAAVLTIAPIAVEPIPDAVEIKQAAKQTAAKPAKTAKTKKVKATSSRSRTKPKAKKKTFDFTPHY